MSKMLIEVSERKGIDMVIRKFNRNFEEVIDLNDCDCAGKVTARQIADSQRGFWDVWFYRPRTSEELVKDAEKPVLRIFPATDFAENMSGTVENDAAITDVE